MPTLATFAEKTGTPKQRRWSDVYRLVREAAECAVKAAQRVMLMRLVARKARRISREDLMRAWQQSEAAKLAVKPLDASHRKDAYRVVDRATWNLILDHFGIGLFDYQSNARDCDKFSGKVWADARWYFRLNSIGLVLDYSGGHAYIAVVVADGDGLDVLFVEPQGDDETQWWVRTPGKGAYDMEFGEAIF